MMTNKRWPALLVALLILSGMLTPALAEVKIPAGTVTIAEEAFMNDPMRELTLPQGLEVIGARAFKGTDLKRVEIPASVRSIGKDAFDTRHPLELLVPADSPAQSWCDANDIHYVIQGYEDSMPVIYALYWDSDWNEPESLYSFECLTSADTDAIALYDANGQEIQRWTEGVPEGTERKWSVEITLPSGFSGWFCPLNGAVRGERSLFSDWESSDSQLMNFYCEQESVWIPGVGEIDIPFSTGADVNFSIYTYQRVDAFRVSDAEGRVLYEASGLGLRSYTSYSFSFAFPAAGDYALKVEASADGVTYIPQDYAETVSVVDGAQVLYARANAAATTVGQPVVVRVLTMPNTARLGLFDGTTPLAVWDSYDGDVPFGLGEDGEGGDITYAFPEPGDYHLTLKASADGSDWSDPGKPLNVRISAAPTVLGIPTDPCFVSLQDKSLTVVTTSDAETLTMKGDYDVEFEWAAASVMPEEQDGRLYWTVELGFSDTGFYAFEFRAGNEAAGYGEAFRSYFTVLGGADIYSVWAYADDDYTEPVSVELTTSISARYVRVYDMDGNVIAEADVDSDSPWYSDWDGNYTWELSLTFAEPGRKLVYARASADGNNWSAKKWFEVALSGSEAQGFEEAFHGSLAAYGESVRCQVSNDDDDFSALQALMLMDGEHNVLARWDREEMEFVEIYGTPYAQASYTFPAPGEYDVTLCISEDGTNFTPILAKTLSVRRHELSSYRSSDDLALDLGPMKYTKSVMNEYAADFYEHYRSCLTPANDPGLLYVAPYSDGMGIQTYKLCGASDWTLDGFAIGMTYDEMTAAAVENHLLPKDAGSWDPDAEMFAYFVQKNDAAAPHYVYIFFEEGTIAEIRTAPYAGE